jgi:predicted enzyme related to lactoylglutathione lyase
MSGAAKAGLFIYAKDCERLTAFYQSILGMTRLHVSSELAVLQSQELQLIVHAIPAQIASTIVITTPPQRREDSALKFFFTVPSIVDVRAQARALGGDVYYDLWDGPGFRACNAIDPEGNVFQLRESTR